MRIVPDEARCLAYNLARESPSSITNHRPKGHLKVKPLYYEYSGQLMYSRRPNQIPKPLSHDHACRQRAHKILSITISQSSTHLSLLLRLS